MRDTLLSPPSTPAEIFRHICLQHQLQTPLPTPQKSYANNCLEWWSLNPWETPEEKEVTERERKTTKKHY